MTDLQQLVSDNTKWYGGHVLLPDDWYQIWEPLNLRTPDGYGVSIGAHSSSGVIVEQMTANTPMLCYEAPGDSRAGLDLHDMTLCSQAGGTIEAIRNINGGFSKYRNLVFQGVSHTIHLDGSGWHSIRSCRVETFNAALCGTMLLECSDANMARYCQYISIDDYQTAYGAYGPLITMMRTSNVTLSHMIAHAPGAGSDGIQVLGDCQGIQISDVSVVGGHDAVLLQWLNGKRPLVVELDSVNADQMSGYHARIMAGTDITIMGGAGSECYNGIEIAPYPDVERVTIVAPRSLKNAHNGIVADYGARYFSISDTQHTGNVNGVGIVTSGGQDHYRIANNSAEPEQGNGPGIVDTLTGSGPHKVVSGNL